MDFILVLLAALAIDVVLGEPPHPVHPVVWMGKIAAFLERGGSGRRSLAQFVYGAGMTLFLIGLFVVPVYFLLAYLESLSSVATIIVGAVLFKTTFSLRELRAVALKIKGLLLVEKLEDARNELGALVSRDTRDLAAPLVVSATVESLAENTGDSFVAPLFYFLFFGVPGAVAYRAVNTLDAMVGYHGRYEYLGKFASRLDDVLNFIPARLTAWLFVAASFLAGKRGRASWRVARDEHRRTASPNAGWAMAAVAGALDVPLEKVGHYKLGAGGAPLVPGTIDAALKLVLLAGWLWVLLCFSAGGAYYVLTS